MMGGLESARQAITSADEIWLNATVHGELMAGFLGGSRFDQNHRDLYRFMEAFQVQQAPIFFETALEYARLVKFLRDGGNPIPSNDVWIAATAVRHGLTVLTLDAHFLRLPQVQVQVQLIS